MKNATDLSKLSSEELWIRTARALDGGDFSLLDDLLAQNDVSIINLLASNGEPRAYMEEAFAWACFTGRTGDAETLLEKGVDPAKGFKTGLAGFHWAANRGNLDTVSLLIERGAPLEQVNMYGGSVLNCAFYSAVHEHQESHAEIIETLIEAGAVVDPGLLDWWAEQNVPSMKTKQRVLEYLQRYNPE